MNKPRAGDRADEEIYDSSKETLSLVSGGSRGRVRRQAMIGAYACSAVTVTLLWMLVRRNQAQGWRRERHPNCFSPMSRSAPSASASPAGTNRKYPLAGALPAMRPIGCEAGSSGLVSRTRGSPCSANKMPRVGHQRLLEPPLWRGLGLQAFLENPGRASGARGPRRGR